MDTYSIKARIYPMLIVYSPFSILLIIIIWNFNEYWHYGIPVGVLSLLAYLTSHLGRDSGKKKEPRLWQDWGGSPTNQLFRWSDNRIDKYTKARNHSKMNTLCSTGNMVDTTYEINNPNESDHIYCSWNSFLRSSTRDISKYPLIFKENINYGFRRNLWGLKPFAILSVIILMVITCLFFMFSIGIWASEYTPMLLLGIEIILSIFLIFWFVVVKKSWVRLVAFEYAKRLHESIDSL